MNVERLATVARALLDEYTKIGVVDQLNSLREAFRTLNSSPGDTNAQVTIQQIRSNLSNVLSVADSNFYPPTWTQTVQDLDLSEMFGTPLLAQVESVFIGTDLTPAVAFAQVMEIAQQAENVRSVLTTLLDSFEFLEISEEDLRPGEFEFSIVIPRVAISNDLKALGQEFIQIRKIIGPFQELTSGSRPDVTVRIISSSDFGVFLETSAQVAACLAVAIERIVTLYKSNLEIRKLKTELNSLTKGKVELKEVETFVSSAFSAEIKKIAEDLLKRHAESYDKNRKPELTTELKNALNSIANRIDIGYNFDVRTSALDASTGEETEEEKAAKAIVIESNAGKSFMKLDGDRILSLPEETSNTN